MRVYKDLSHILLILLFMLLPIWSEAFPCMQLDETINYQLQDYLYALDNSSELTLDEVQKVPFESFVKIDDYVPHLQRNTFVWFAVRVKNNTSFDQVYYLESGITQYIYFYDIENSKYVEKKYGYAVPDVNKEYSEIIVELVGFRLNAGEEKLLYFKIKSELNWKPSPLFRIHNQIDFKEHVANFNIIYGCILGFIILMIVYGAFLYMGIRNKAFIYYIIYASLMAIATFILIGYPRHYLFPSYRIHVLLSEVILQIDCVVYLTLFRNILEVDTKHRNWRIFFSAYTTVLIVGVVLSLTFLFVDFYVYNLLTQIFTFLGLISFIIVIVGLFRYRTEITRLYFIGNIILTVGSMIITIGLLFLHEPFLNYLNEFLFGVCAELICYTIGLSKQFQFVEEQKREVQVKLIKELKEKERIQMQVNEELECKVNERTIEILNSKQEIERQKAELALKHMNLEKSNKQLVENLEYAGFIQNALMCDFNSLKANFSDGFFLYQPHSFVSGDFFMYFNLPDGRTLVTVADCTGHGVPGAILTIISQNFISDIVMQQGILNPATILERLEDRFHLHLLNNSQNRTLSEGLDIAMVLIDQNLHKLTYAGAKIPLYLVHGGLVKRNKGRILGIGGECFNVGKRGFDCKEFLYNRGDMIYMSSDGYIDQLNDDNKKYMSSQFIDFLSRVWTLPADIQYHRFIDEHNEWRGEQEQIDDILIVALRL